MKKGKKMPDISIEGTSEEEFEFRDGKIVRKQKPSKDPEEGS